jgi:ubiquinone/menaquinone biosynthesis C-methylase UbiE
MVTIPLKHINYWPDSKCARAFWGQHEVAPYRQLLADTIALAEPRVGDRWLDLGCGCGQLSQAIWQKSNGQVAEVVGLDCAAVNAEAFRKLCSRLQPRPCSGQIRFECSDFSAGLAAFADRYFAGVISGLAIQYAESFSDRLNRWTTEAYDHLLAEVLRVLRPGGSFVFSVNVPEPAWGKVALGSLGGIWRTNRPLRLLAKSVRMMRYGAWLKRQARTGRFHYLPCAEIVGKLENAGFADIEHRLSYAGQAYLLRCRRPCA